MTSSIVLFDSLARTALPAPALQDRPVSFYACGITPYSAAHVGHARSFVVFDAMRQMLERAGHSVALVRNVTDIDDKIIQQAQQEGVLWSDLSRRHHQINEQQMAQMGVTGHETPMASAHMTDIIAVIERLWTLGHAYQAPHGDVLFDTLSFPGSSLARHDPDNLSSSAATGGRVSTEGKRHPSDFVLWKPAKPGEPFWDSPWGHGRPGWHIECSAMIERRFGSTLDYHGGGIDLRFPHHQAEIQQSEAAFGRPLAHRWVHHGSVRDAAGQKMSKSLGNVVLISDALDKAASLLPEHAGFLVRLALLDSMWTQPLDWSDDRLLSARTRLLSWSSALGPWIQSTATPADIPATSRAGIDAAWAANMNTPRVFSLIHQAANAALKGDAVASAQVAYGLQTLGVLSPALSLFAAPSVAPPEVIVSLWESRQAARLAKNWSESDRFRTQIEEQGWVVKDQADGSILERQTAPHAAKLSPRTP